MLNEVYSLFKTKIMNHFSLFDTDSVLKDDSYMYFQKAFINRLLLEKKGSEINLLR